LGPFYSDRIELARKTLNHKNIHIYIRDVNNYQYVRETLKIDKAMDAADLAFLDLARQNDDSLSNLLEKYSLTKNNYITLVPSGLWKHYHPNRDEYVEAWRGLVQALLTAKGYEKLKIVLMPHVIKPEDSDDRLIIRDICKKVESDRLIAIHDEMLPFQARHILGNGRMTVTGRMHAAVSTFQMGKPAISLSYSVKYAGVIGKGLKREDLIIEGKDEKLYSGDNMAKAVLEKVKYVNDNYDRLVAEIKPEVEKQKVKAMKQIDDIARKIMGEG
jgi:colanic acid/amylovoran biosynthesis protein